MLNIIAGVFSEPTPPAPLNSYESIATVLVGSGGSSSISFSSIPSTFKHLQLRAIMRGTTAAAQVQVDYRFNGNSSNVYTYHHIQGNGSSASAVGVAASNTGNLQRATAANAAANIFGTMIVDILDYANTSKNKTVRALGGEDQNGSGLGIFFVSNAFLSTDAINSILLYPNSGNWAQYSQFALYGIKG
jgi:hypothetical protein